MLIARRSLLLGLGAALAAPAIVRAASLMPVRALATTEGRMWDVRIYDKALNLNEIEKMFLECARWNPHLYENKFYYLNEDGSVGIIDATTLGYQDG